MNNRTTKILIADDTAKFGIRLASQLRDMGYQTLTRKNTASSVLNTVLSEGPDIVITDLTLRDTDAVALMKQIRSHTPKAPHFIVASDIDNSFIEKQVTESGAAYFLVQPLQAEAVHRAVTALSRSQGLSEDNDTLIKITKTIQSLGVPAHIKGYHYLRAAILFTVEKPALLTGITKELYPMIARRFNTTSSRVERAIRHAIEITWERAGSDRLVSFFGFTYSGRPTNSEFIAFISDRIRLTGNIRMSVFPEAYPQAL
ncbi:MAG: response regulator [Ruminococcus sp.]|nr:response regulator [Ruminococcus sp.]